jgi:GWxTD domain-containing protein
MIDSSLRIAARLAPDSGRYSLILGRYDLYAELPTLRVQAPKLFLSALASARRAGDSALVAEAADEIGMVAWRRYDALADRRRVLGDVYPQADALITDERKVKALLTQGSAAYVPPVGDKAYAQAARAFRAALAADAGNLRARRHIYMTLAERQEWDSLAAEAGERVMSAPYDPDAWLALGLARHRLHQDGQASAAFDSALARMNPRERARYTSIALILRPSDSSRYTRMDSAARQDFDRVFWDAADPLALTPGNELQLEFLSRVTYANLRWSSDDLDILGSSSDRGQIYVRYGPPGTIASFAPQTNASQSCEVMPGGSTVDEQRQGAGVNPIAGGGTLMCAEAQAPGDVMTIWYYPALGLHFVFRAPPSYGTANFTIDYAGVAEEARQAAPAAWTNLPINRHPIDSMAAVVTRFRGDNDSTDAIVVASIPMDHLRRAAGAGAAQPIDLAFIAYDARGRLVVRDSTRKAIPSDAQFELHAWRHRFGPGGILYRVEALEPDSLRAARSVGEAKPLPGLGFGLSDVLVADRITPRGAGERWRDFLVTPNAGVLRKGQSLGLLWETYWLTAKDGGDAYTVSITIERAAGGGVGGLAARILSGVKSAIGLSAQGQDRVTLSFNRQSPTQLVVTDYVTMDLGAIPAGSYTVTVSVTDRNAERTESRSRSVVVVP